MIVYRDACQADGPKIDAMGKAIWLETFEHSASPADIALYIAGAYGPEGALIRDLADPAKLFHVACDGDAIIGYAKISKAWLTDPAITPGAWQLSQLYIAGPYHGRGVAQALMAWTIETARANGAAALVLTVWEHNPRAQRFYEKYGMVHIADYAFPTGNQIDRDLIMQMPL